MQYSTTVVQWVSADIPGNRWRNVLEWDVPGDLTFNADTARQLNTISAAYFRAMALESTVIDRAVTGSYGANLLPGDEFVVTDYGLAGLASLGGQEPMAIPVALVVNKNTEVGRSGRMWLRGALTEADAIYAGSYWVARPQVNDRLTAASSNLFAAATSAGATLALVRGSSALPIVKPVTALAIGGVFAKSLRRRSTNAVPRSGAVRGLVDAIVAIQDSAPAVNAVIEAYNALPLSDLPLLPG